jgi:hypothetical protein
MMLLPQAESKEVMKAVDKDENGCLGISRLYLVKVE